MLITPEPGIRSTIKIRNKKGGSFHFEAIPLKVTYVYVIGSNRSVDVKRIFSSSIICRYMLCDLKKTPVS